MANEAILKEFLISLGFKIDKPGEKDFVDTVTITTVKVLGLATAATAALAAVAKIADSLERLYFASRRTGASAENIQAFSLSVKQLGGDSGQAAESIENIARLLRNSPGGEGLLRNIGINTRDANGQLRDTVDMMGDLGDKFAGMPYYKANAYAQALGIDEKTLMAMRQGLGQFSAQYKQMLHASGLDLQAATKNSHAFMSEVRSLGSAFTILQQLVESKLNGKIGDSVRRLREGFVLNFGRISDAVDKVIGFTLRVGEAFFHLTGRGAELIGKVFDWFNSLSDGSQSAIKWLGLVLVAWRALSVGFLASPLGRVVALSTALVALWDDYQTWAEGGKSLIDWENWKTEIDIAIKIIEPLRDILKESLTLIDQLFARKLNIPGVSVQKVERQDGGKTTIMDEVGEFTTRIKAFLGDPTAKKTIEKVDADRNARAPQPGAPTDAASLFGNLEKRYGLPSGLLDSVWSTESGRGKNMTSPAGAQGHFQLMPKTAEAYGVKNPNDLQQSADAAARMYADLLKWSHGNLPQALAGYNWGAGNVDKFGMNKMPAETRDYIGKVTSAMPQQSAAPTVTQTTNITVSGADDPRALVRDISSAQNGVNERMVRNMRGAVLQ